ncbi:MAG: hypothetical protein HYU69_15180 [Bacteroidetes bacterium]|nr:hypothetical protein [Bacteroidota bacterium]
MVSEQLFDLIDSLTPAEKRYFKVFAYKHTRGDKNNYVRLFEAIEAQEKYDEKQIKDKFKGETFIKHLPSEKNYLYNLILDTLYYYHRDSTAEFSLNKLLHNVSVLYQKGLYGQCRKLLIKIRTLSRRMNLPVYMHQALAWEKKIMLVNSFVGVTEQKLSDVFAEGNAAIRNISDHTEYINLQARLLFFINRRGEIRSKVHHKYYSSVINSRLLQNESKIADRASLYIFYNIHYIYNFYAKADLVTAYNYVQKSLKLMEDDVEQIKDNPNTYIVLLNNLVVSCIPIKRYDEVNHALKKMRNIEHDLAIRLSEEIKPRIFVRSYILEVDMYINSGSFEKSGEIINDIENGMKLYAGKMDKASERILRYNVAYLFFGYGNYKRTIEWISMILNDADMETKQDIISFARILQIISHYEMENIDILPYLFKINSNYSKKGKVVYKSEAIILDCIAKAGKASSSEGRSKVFRHTKKKFMQIVNDPYEKKAFRYFDFISWLESKIENKTFAEIVRNKARQVTLDQGRE